MKTFKDSKHLMMKFSRRLVPLSFLMIFFLVSLYSCKPEKDDKPVDLCAEGRTGELQLSATMIHHTRPIKGCKLFIKYNATEFPGEDTSLYDFHVTAPNNSAVAVIDSLNCGNYYLYAVGIDSLLDPSGWLCKGGLPFSTDKKSGSVSINVYITEGD